MSNKKTYLNERTFNVFSCFTNTGTVFIFRINRPRYKSKSLNNIHFLLRLLSRQVIYVICQVIYHSRLK